MATQNGSELAPIGVSDLSTHVQFGDQFRRQIGKISRQSAVFFAGTLFTVAVGYLFKIYVARVLGAKALGFYALGMSVVSFFSLFASLGLPRTAARFVAAYNGTGQVDKLRGFLWRSLALIVPVSTGLSGLMMLGRRWIAEGMYHEPSLTPYLPLFALMIPIGAVGLFFGQVLAGYQNVARRTVITSFIQFPLKIALTLGLFALGWGLWGYITGDVVSALVALMLMGWIVWKLTPDGARCRKGPLPSMERDVVLFAGYMVAMNVLGFLSAQADRVLLGIYLDARQVGIYSVAMTTAAFIPTLLQSVNSIFGPVIADLHARGERDLLQRLFQTLTKWVFSLTWPLVVVIIVFAPTLMRIFGAEFEPGWPVLVMVAAGQLVNVGTGSVGYLLQMSGNQRLELFAVAITAAVTLMLNLLLIPSWGVLGAGLAMTVGLVISNLYRLWQVHRVLGLIPYNHHCLRLLFPLGASGMATITARQWIHGGVWPEWAGVLLVLLFAYGVFAFTTLFMGLDDDDRIIARAVWVRMRRVLRWIPKGIK